MPKAKSKKTLLPGRYPHQKSADITAQIERLSNEIFKTDDRDVRNGILDKIRKLKDKQSKIYKK